MESPHLIEYCLSEILNCCLPFTFFIFLFSVNFVFGIPTVARENAYYLIETLKALVHHTSVEEKEEVLIVVYISCCDNSYKDKVRQDIQNTFPEETEKGFIKLLAAPENYFPPLKKLPLLYGDNIQRVTWRSRQSLDYSYLYYYCAGIGKYYIQLEDDVMTEPNYLSKMKAFIKAHDGKWSVLEFGARGFIGMTYQTTHLKSLAKFVRFYFWTMPVDWLFRVYNDIYLYGNSKHHVLKPPVFKHIGKVSSLKGQVRKLEDLKNDIKKETIMSKRNYQPEKGNPPAFLSTSIGSYVYPYDIDKPYSKHDVFWGRDINENDHILIYFEKITTIKRIVIVSGSPSYPEDRLDNSKLLLAKDSSCKSFGEVKTFNKTSLIDYTFQGNKTSAKCIKLLITSVRRDEYNNNRWLIINEIAVISDKNQ